MRLKSYRRTSQFVFTLLTVSGLFGIGTFGIIYPYFFCYACPFDIGACPLGMLEHGAADARLFGLMEGIAVIGYALGTLLLLGAFFGRGFCGWACPVGLLQDTARKTKAHKAVGKAVAPNGMDSRLRWIKYGFVFAIPILSYIFLDLVYTRFCPVGGVTGTLPTLLFYPGEWAPSTWFAVKVISIVAFLGLIVSVGRGWCKYLCPVGAILAPTNKCTPLRLIRDEESCTGCNKCERECPMDLEEIGKKTDAECILCGRCTTVCNQKCLRLKYAPAGRGTRVTALLVVTILVAGSLFAYGLAGVGYERTDEVNAIPCLGCLALDPAGSSDFAPFEGAQPSFVTSALPYRPIFIHYRTDVCSACDEMEPTIHSLESEFGDRVKFIHINLDHADAEQFASYDLYDVKGSPDSRTGVPMFVCMTRVANESGEAALYSVFYGITAREKLSDALNYTIENHVPIGSVQPSETKASVELFVDTTCTYCPYSEDALVEMKNEGAVNFVSYVTDAPGISGAYPKYREEMYRAHFGKPSAHPWAIFAGGQADELGGAATVGETYGAKLATVEFFDGTLSVTGSTNDTGTSLSIAVEVTNPASTTVDIQIEGYLTERTSRWLNLRNEPIPYAFVDLVINGTYAVPAGGSQAIDVAWSGTDVLPYSSFRPSNLALVIAVRANGQFATSIVVESASDDGIRFSSPYAESVALPNGTAQFEVALKNPGFEPATVEFDLEAPSGWKWTAVPATLTVPANNGTGITMVSVTSSNVTLGDVVSLRLVARGITDPTLFATGALSVEIKSDVVFPTIATPRLNSTLPEGTESVRVSVAVGDNAGLSSVKIAWYSCTDTTCSAIVTRDMNLTGNEYVCNISSLRPGDIIVHYKIVATDTSGNVRETRMFDLPVEPIAEEAESAGGPPVELGLLIMAYVIIIGICLISAGRLRKKGR
jgi:ferredoxin-type protein NapH